MKKLFLRSPILIILLGVSLLLGGGLGYAFFFGGGSVNLQKGLVGQWKFDGTAQDATPYNKDGTLNGNAAVTANDRKGQANKAVTLDGDGDFVNIGNITQLNGASKATFSMWLKLRTLDGSGSETSTFISRFTSGDAGQQFDLFNGSAGIFNKFLLQ